MYGQLREAPVQCGFEASLDAIADHCSTAAGGYSRAGVPCTRTPEGTSRTTTAPAPIVASSPIVVPLTTVAPMPIVAPAPIRALPPIFAPGLSTAPAPI